MLQPDVGVELFHAIKDFYEKVLAHPIVPPKKSVCVVVSEK
jgi:hypothetical protein